MWFVRFGPVNVVVRNFEVIVAPESTCLVSEGISVDLCHI